MKPLVAVVEDNEDNLALLEAILDDDFDLVCFSDGPSALAKMADLNPRLLLLDISLPSMSGVEVLGQLRADPRTKDLIVVALTAHAMAGDRERFLADGFDDYFAKPIVDEDALIALVHGLLK